MGNSSYIMFQMKAQLLNYNKDGLLNNSKFENLNLRIQFQFKSQTLMITN